MQIHTADSSLKGKLRRRYTRLLHRRPARMRLDRPMVSFTFDDAPASAAQHGAAILEAKGARGTYFISGGLTGKDGPMGPNATAVQLRQLLADGHELACHTHSHLDCGQAGMAAIDADVRCNAQSLSHLGAPPPVAFAYPYGDVSIAAKRALGARFGVMRALHPGLIANGSDLNQAPGVGIEGSGGEAVASRWIDRGLKRPGWLILYTHDVGQAPSPWGCTPATLERLVSRVLSGGAEIVTVGEGCRRIGARAGG